MAAQNADQTGRNEETGGMTDQARNAAAGVASTATGYAQDAFEATSEYARSAYDATSRYVRDQREQYPEADRYIRQGTRYVRSPVRENPILAVMIAGAIAYGLAYLIHSDWNRR